MHKLVKQSPSPGDNWDFNGSNVFTGDPVVCLLLCCCSSGQKLKGEIQKTKGAALRGCAIHLPFLVVVADDVDVVFDNASILDGIGIDPEPSFTARLSNLIDSVVAINNTFCIEAKNNQHIKRERREKKRKCHRLNYCFRKKLRRRKQMKRT